MFDGGGDRRGRPRALPVHNECEGPGLDDAVGIGAQTNLALVDIDQLGEAFGDLLHSMLFGGDSHA